MSDSIILRNATADVLFCHRNDDCMFVSGTLHIDDVCSLMVYGDEENAKEKLCHFQMGRRVKFRSAVALSSHLFRGSYDVRLQLDSNVGSGCWWFSNINIVAGRFWTWIFDYTSAATSFLTASASSYVIGQYFPKLTNGLIPQITGFVLLGVVVGPYVTNFVSRFYIYLLESIINRLSLGFISLAAGAEIYLPHLTGLLTPILCLVASVGISTFVFIGTGLVIVMHWMEVPLMGSCPEKVSYSVIMLMACIMVARSPSSTVAVVQEMVASRHQAAKITIGTTICSDLVVLVCFSLCTHLVSMKDGPVLLLLLVITRDVFASVVYGLLWSFPIKWLLELWQVEEAVEPDVDKHSLHGLPFVLLLKHHDWRLVVQGMLLFVMIFAMREGEQVFQLLGIKIDPLLVPFFASCYVVHVGAMRRRLHRILASWMPTVFLPFFTLTGASLNLQMVTKLLPWAMLIFALRFFAIYVAAAGASWATSRPVAEIKWMGITLISQAGISLGLALEVQSHFTWGRDFSSLVIAIVVINQLFGPILCKIGMRKMVEADVASEIRSRRPSEYSALEDEDFFDMDGEQKFPGPMTTVGSSVYPWHNRVTSSYAFTDLDDGLRCASYAGKVSVNTPTDSDDA